MAKQQLVDAKKAKNDEFFTQLIDIQREVNVMDSLDSFCNPNLQFVA